MTRGAEPSEQASGEHAPVAPDWTCGSCGHDWPCDTKRDRLLHEYRADRASLSVYLGSCLAAASHDLRAAPTAALQDRFIGWVPRGPRIA
ncbi:hypothetical protein [Micromonospora auratinigra]|uniref:Flavin reductase n=1 Tax=Micromonospora auratinigra TaxID=261654 RepID=A0A1A9A6A1_9ACTN|nr:hypothetical protein [Micromonospora auratinigra]SBT51630.1 hypothetical protein GA0070611_5263 [Micromonospora auratinigra]